MTIYSLYIYDRYTLSELSYPDIASLRTFNRHCTCVYYQDWHRAKQPKQAAEGGLLPAVSQLVYPKKQDNLNTAAASTFNSPRNTLSSATGIIIAVNEEQQHNSQSSLTHSSQPQSTLPFDEEAKLVYGVVLSLRNMIKKISGKYVPTCHCISAPFNATSTEPSSEMSNSSITARLPTSFISTRHSPAINS